jgi:uncharacterized protein (DUF1778 family)
LTYPDPKRVRSHRLTLRLDDYEHALLSALANYQGEQLATLLRELVMREAQQMLGRDTSVEQRSA